MLAGTSNDLISVASRKIAIDMPKPICSNRTRLSAAISLIAWRLLWLGWVVIVKSGSSGVIFHSVDSQYPNFQYIRRGWDHIAVR